MKFNENGFRVKRLLGELLHTVHRWQTPSDCILCLYLTQHKYQELFQKFLIFSFLFIIFGNWI